MLSASPPRREPTPRCCAVTALPLPGTGQLPSPKASAGRSARRDGVSMLLRHRHRHQQSALVRVGHLLGAGGSSTRPVRSHARALRRRHRRNQGAASRGRCAATSARICLRPGLRVNASRCCATTAADGAPVQSAWRSWAAGGMPSRRRGRAASPRSASIGIRSATAARRRCGAPSRRRSSRAFPAAACAAAHALRCAPPVSTPEGAEQPRGCAPVGALPRTHLGVHR